jgi:hypothetical protein
MFPGVNEFPSPVVRRPHRPSYSQRRGNGPLAKPLEFGAIAQQLVHVITRFIETGRFQEAFGDECVDAGPTDGTLGPDPSLYILQATGRELMWPLDREVAVGDGEDPFGPPELGPVWKLWDEDAWFDLIEVLSDLVSKPTHGGYHDYSACGWHFYKFDGRAGQEEFREEINHVLSLGDPVYALNADGEVTVRAPGAFQRLTGAAVPAGTDKDTITSKIRSAERSFESRHATRADRQHAVRDLVDVLELLRDDLKEVMLKDDESALFNIANNFWIRHNNRKQRLDYDDEVWLRWMFYVYLSTIHAVLRIKARKP